MEGSLKLLIFDFDDIATYQSYEASTCPGRKRRCPVHVTDGVSFTDNEGTPKWFFILTCGQSVLALLVWDKIFKVNRGEFLLDAVYRLKTLPKN